MVVPLLAIALAACASNGGASPGATGAAASATTAPGAAAGELQVYAAASLKAVLAKVTDAYETANPGTRVTVSTDSSAALETKIEQGAPADVFLSADTKNPQALVDMGLASGTVTTYAGNLLTVIVPTSNPARITTPGDLAKPGVKIIACVDGVPIQGYTVTLLENLVKTAGYPTDFAARYAANVVSREDNVSAIVAKVGLGEGDAGIVYVTDARTTATVDTVAIPPSANVPATYGGVVVRASTSRDAAGAFLAWLAGTDGQAILASFGFLPPS
ncbi:MAG: molybdate ABC transporter substrate-binding protein [Candidatus Limnocylindrales bacterium]